MSAAPAAEKTAKKPKFTVTLNTKPPESNWVGNFAISIAAKSTYAVTLTVVRAPTQNCQLSSVGTVYNLLHAIKEMPEDEQRAIARGVIAECYRLLGQATLLCVMDVNQTWIPQLEKCYHVLHKHPYTSTNGSKMCLCLVQLSGHLA